MTIPVPTPEQIAHLVEVYEDNPRAKVRGYVVVQCDEHGWTEADPEAASGSRLTRTGSAVVKAAIRAEQERPDAIVGVA